MANRWQPDWTLEDLADDQAFVNRYGVAENVSIVDAQEHFDSDNVEGALAEGMNDNAAARGAVDAANVSISGDTMTGPLIIDSVNNAIHQAARLTAYDNTTGQLAIGGIELGDTGWRTVTLENSWTGTLYVRRSGNTVQVWAQTSLNGTSASNNTFYSLPIGFRPEGYDYNASPTGLTTWARTYCAALSGACGSAHRGTGLSLSHTFTTTNAWPASLPGTPV